MNIISLLCTVRPWPSRIPPIPVLTPQAAGLASSPSLPPVKLTKDSVCSIRPMGKLLKGQPGRGELPGGGSYLEHACDCQGDPLTGNCTPAAHAHEYVYRTDAPRSPGPRDPVCSLSTRAHTHILAGQDEEEAQSDQGYVQLGISTFFQL